jgi:hypothetical protein
MSGTAAVSCPREGCPSDTADAEFGRDEDGYTVTWLTCIVCGTLWRL